MGGGVSRTPASTQLKEAAARKYWGEAERDGHAPPGPLGLQDPRATRAGEGCVSGPAPPKAFGEGEEGRDTNATAPPSEARLAQGYAGREPPAPFVSRRLAGGFRRF